METNRSLWLTGVDSPQIPSLSDLFGAHYYVYIYIYTYTYYSYYTKLIWTYVDHAGRGDAWCSMVGRNDLTPRNSSKESSTLDDTVPSGNETWFAVKIWASMKSIPISFDFPSIKLIYFELSPP